MTTGKAAGPIDLAREGDFRLGDLAVSPATGRVSAGGRELRIQPRVMEVLVLLTRRAGRTVTRDELIDACWSGRIVTDNAVHRVLAQVRALARLTDPPPFVLETVPKVGVRLIAAQSSETADEAGPPRPTTTSARPQRRRPRTWRGRPLAAVGMAVVFAVGAAWLWGAWRSARTQESGQNGRVEVLSFEPRSGGADVRRAAAAVPDNLIHVLSRAGVAASGPARDGASPSVAELQVSGSVGAKDHGYVIEARILDRRSGLVLWTDRLVRDAGDMVRSPAEPAAGIGAVLNCAIEDRKAAKTPISTEAFGLYLNTCAGVFLSDDHGQRMLVVARRLVKAAPRFAGAHAMHAIAAARVAAFMDTPEQANALHAEARAAAERALELDPRAAKAYCGLALNEGVLSNRMAHNVAAEEAYLKKALALDPDLAPARNEYATLLRATGRLREAIEFMRASTAAEDPRYPGDPRPAMLLAAQGDLPAAEEELQRLETLSQVSYDDVRATIAFWWEDPRIAVAKVRTVGDPDERDCLVAYLTELDTRRRAHARGLPRACDAIDPSWRVRMLAREGDVDGAFATIGGRMPGGPLLLYYPEMAAVRSDPRFWALAKRIGLLQYWRSSGRWPDFCAAPGQDCRGAAAAATGARTS